MKKILLLFLALVLCFAFCSCEKDSADTESKNSAPDFTVLDKNGNEVNLSDYMGTPVVINFWASWCPPCKAELPDFDKACAEFDDVVFLMVNLTDGKRETKAIVDEFISENGYKFPVYYDTEYSAAYAYNVSSIPATYFIDADGNIAESHIGMINYDTLVDGINKIR